MFVASTFDGYLNITQVIVQEQQTLDKNQKADWSTWKKYDAKTPMKLEAPTAWVLRFHLRPWRNYTIEPTRASGRPRSSPSSRPSIRFWSIQAMRWKDPPAIQNPDSTQTIKGRVHALYQDSHLHLVAWQEHGTLYWVINTLDNQLSQRPHPGSRGLV